MEPQDNRRNERVSLQVPIQVSGTDVAGRLFVEQTRTLAIGRYGAKIVLKRTLAPDQELSIRCVKTGKEADALVLGQAGRGPEGYHYGVTFVNPEVNIWGIEFPAATESGRAVARVLLECGHCHAREVACLNEFEAEVFEASLCLSRPCKRCGDTSVWKESAGQLPEQPVPLPVAPKPVQLPTPDSPPRTQNEREDIRVSLRMNACIRHPLYGEQIVATENVSRGGFRFKTSKVFPEGCRVEVALPYSPGAGNIFVSARVEQNLCRGRV